MATGWTVVAQNQVDDLDASTGAFVASMEVHFTTVPEGMRGKITVPLNQYNADNVRTLIESRVAEMKAVHSL